MNNAELSATELLTSIGWRSPRDFTLEEIANYLGAFIKEEKLDGSEGRIIISNKSAIITVNSSINYQPKRNFVVAHEIGHFRLHRNLERIYSDTDKTLHEWYKSGLHERQANDFASELLMPRKHFNKLVDKENLSIDLIRNTSLYFGTSLIATFLRYVNHGKFPLMVIFMENKKVKWKKYSVDFPFKFLILDSEVPAYTVAGDYFKNGVIEDQPEKVEAIEWFPEDYQIKYKSDWKLWEQCFPVGHNSLVSCLWTF
jgi:Zn-dependent peptidase ImmA (M78 family)